MNLLCCILEGIRRSVKGISGKQRHNQKFENKSEREQEHGLPCRNFTILFCTFTQSGFPILQKLGMMIAVGYIKRIHNYKRRK